MFFSFLMFQIIDLILGFIHSTVNSLYFFFISLNIIFFSAWVAFFKRFYVFIFEEEKGRKGEKHQYVVASHCTLLGAWTQPRYVPWLGIKPVTPWFTGPCSTHWAIPAWDFFFMVLKYSVISLSILITSVLNSVSNRLLISILFSSFSGFWSALSFGPYFFVSSFWQSACVCFYVLGRAALTPCLSSMAYCRKVHP